MNYPFLNKLEADTVGRAQIRVCADDTGAVLASIPTFHPFSPDIIEKSRQWLVINIPPWSGFKISDSAKYLVFSWAPRWRQILDRVGAQAGGPLSRHCSHGRRRLHVFLSLQAEPVLGYVGQLMILPDDVYRKERALLHRILHIPH